MLKAILVLSLMSSLSFAEQKGDFKIEGMTCDSCVKSIKAKVCTLPGVESCEVKVGEMTLKSKTTLDVEAIKKAVTSTGEYKIVSEKISPK